MNENTSENTAVTRNADRWETALNVILAAGPHLIRAMQAAARVLGVKVNGLEPVRKGRGK
jgi:hypothetical protein